MIFQPHIQCHHMNNHESEIQYEKLLVLETGCLQEECPLGSSFIFQKFRNFDEDKEMFSCVIFLFKFSFSLDKSL